MALRERPDPRGDLRHHRSLGAGRTLSGATGAGFLAELHRRLLAHLLTHWMTRHHARLRPHRERLLENASGTLLEIGPGGGQTLRELPGSTARWLGLEPNRHFFPTLRARAGEPGAPRSFLLQGSVQAIPLRSGSVDAVLSHLVLCSVPAPEIALGEILRVLRPGGRLLLLEHVAAPEGSWLRRWQRLLGPAWRCLADGCCLDRELEPMLRGAGFAKAELEHLRLPVPLVSPHVCGWLAKATGNSPGT